MSQPASGRRSGPTGAGGGSSGSAAWNLGVVNVDDGAFWEPLPNSGVNVTPYWSPDGERGTQVVFAGNKGLMVQSVDGQEAFQLTSDPKDISPAWSQYGNYIAFLTDRSGQWEIWVANSDGSNSRPLLDTERSTSRQQLRRLYRKLTISPLCFVNPWSDRRCPRQRTVIIHGKDFH